MFQVIYGLIVHLTKDQTLLITLVYGLYLN
jgi:hypothetical protein